MVYLSAAVMREHGSLPNPIVVSKFHKILKIDITFVIVLTS